jgi:hypothetical protein
MKNRPDLEWYCETCETTRIFKYVSSVAALPSKPEQHFYSCKSGCGRTYEHRVMLSIDNIQRLRSNVTTE